LFLRRSCAMADIARVNTSVLVNMFQFKYF